MWLELGEGVGGEDEVEIVVEGGKVFDFVVLGC